MKANLKTILVFALIVITLCFALPFVLGNQSTTVKIENYSELLEKFSDEQEAVTYFTINTDGQVYLETYPLVRDPGTGDVTVNKDAVQKKTYSYQLAFLEDRKAVIEAATTSWASGGSRCIRR